MYSFIWRREGSTGISWYIRGIGPEGHFYGTVHKRWEQATTISGRATTISGLIPAADWERCQEILREFETRDRPPPGPCFALLGCWTESLGSTEILFKYELGDEAVSEDARAFVELKTLLEKEISKVYASLAE